MDAQPSQVTTAAAPAVPAPATAASTAARAQAVRAMAFDAPRTFLGPRADYYDESWRWMDWTGRKWSWNGAAALGFAGWLAYRRMYWLAAPALLWPIAATALVVDGVPVVLVALLHAGIALLLGFYGNTLYLGHFRRRVRTVLEDDHGARLAALARLGGTDPRAAAGAAALGLGLVAGTMHLFGDESVSLRWF